MDDLVSETRVENKIFVTHMFDTDHSIRIVFFSGKLLRPDDESNACCFIHIAR